MLELFCRYYNWHKQIRERLVPFISACYLLFFSKFNSSLVPFLFLRSFFKAGRWNMLKSMANSPLSVMKIITVKMGMRPFRKPVEFKNLAGLPTYIYLCLGFEKAP